MPSQKIRAFTRTVMNASPNNTALATTTDWMGYVLYRPTIAGDVSVLTVTNGGFPAGAITNNTAFSSANWPVASLNMTKIPFLAAAFTANNVQGRLVSACIRIRYSGLEDLRSGIISLFEDPDHIDVSGQSLNTISQFDSCGRARPGGDGEWHQINWSGPAKQQETEYVTTANGVTGSFAPPCIIITVQGLGTTAGAYTVQPSFPFETECWQNLEFIGRDAIGKTNNMLDEQGAKNVFAAAKDAQSQTDPFSPTGPGANRFLNTIRNMTAPRAGGSMLGNLAQAAASAIHPGLGAAWGVGRNLVNTLHPGRRRPSSTY